MRVRNSPAGLAATATKANADHLVLLIEKTRDLLGVDKKDFSEHIGVSKDLYLKILRAEKELPIQAVSNFCRRFDLSVESVQRNTVDLDVLLERMQGGKGTLPKRYGIGAFSRRRSGSLFFEWMERYLGAYAREEVMRHFQVDAETFSKPDETISIRFFEEATAYTARRFGVRMEEFQDIGKLSFEHTRRTAFSRAVRTQKTVADAYERFVLDLKPFNEDNYDFKLMRLSRERCSVHVSARPAVLEALNAKQIGNAFTCAWRQGLFSVIPRYIGKEVAAVKKTRCVHAGDAYCRFEMDYSN